MRKTPALSFVWRSVECLVSGVCSVVCSVLAQPQQTSQDTSTAAALWWQHQHLSPPLSDQTTIPGVYEVKEKGMMEGGRLVALLLVIVLMSETGLQLYSHMRGWEVAPQPAPVQEEIQPADKGRVLTTITTHCLPKLVCQLFSLQTTETLSDSERNLISLVGWVRRHRVRVRTNNVGCRTSSLSGHPSKYNFAAHMGQLVRGVEGGGCHQFYPECPFSNQMLMEIAKRINFKWAHTLQFCLRDFADNLWYC